MNTAMVFCSEHTGVLLWYECVRICVCPVQIYEHRYGALSRHPAHTEQSSESSEADNVSMASHTRARRLVGGTPGGYGLLFECLPVDMCTYPHTPAGLLEAIGDPHPLQARCLT